MLSQKQFNKLIGFLLAIKAAVLVYYVFVGWTISLGSWTMPTLWLVIAIVVDVYLAWVAFGLTKKKR